MVSTTNRLIALVALTAVAPFLVHARTRESAAQEGPDWLKGLPQQQHDSVWLKRDTRRAQPPEVTPATEPGAPP